MFGIACRTPMAPVIAAMACLCLSSGFRNIPQRLGYDRLTADLLAGYSKTTPAFLSDDNTTIYVHLIPVAVIDVGHFGHTFYFETFSYFFWYDPRLTWNPSDYNNINQIQVPTNLLWKPTLLLLNSVENPKLESNIPFVVQPSGLVIYGVYGVSKTACRLHVSRFPFDTQHCRLSITSLRGTNYKFHLLKTDLSLNEYFDISSEWILRNFDDQVIQQHFEQTIDVAEIVVTLERKNVFYVVSTIVPLFLLSVVTPLVFLFPPRPGEQMGYLVNILLSYGMFFNFIVEFIPRTSSYVTNFELYLTVVLLHCGLATITMVALLNYNVQKERRAKTENQSKPASELPVSTNWFHEEPSHGSTRFKLHRNRVCFVLFQIGAIAAPSVLLL